MLDENGEAVEIAIRNPEKYIDKKIPDKIAMKHTSQIVKKTIIMLNRELS